MTEPLTLNLDKVYEEEDFTYYIPTEKVEEVLLKNKTLLDRKRSKSKLWCSFDCTARLMNEKKAFLIGRANIAKCFKGNFCAVTIRKEIVSGCLDKLSLPEKSILISADGWYPSKMPKSDRFLVSLDELSKVLKEIIIGEEVHPSGLVVFSGSTNSAKSQTARAFISKIMDGKKILSEMAKLLRQRVLTLSACG